MDVIWKHIPFLPERFEASTDGQIRTLAYAIEYVQLGKPCFRSVAGRVLTQRYGKLQPRGPEHLHVSISLGGTRKKANKSQMRVGYLVAAAFHGVPFDRFDTADIHRWKLRFIDGDVKNCSPANLEWVVNCMDTGDGQQAKYELNRDQWNAVDAGSVFQRLFEETAA